MSLKFFLKKCGSSPPDFVIFVLICGDLFCKNYIKDCLKEEKCFKSKKLLKKIKIVL